ncbi:uncharacterized protein LOC143429214 [Xylocopa sonorina]|uniref:uncharacterized protein LOC143429214 n=1 Tax=Xylocopa sonorina TaxID=1818115 RepID=UPI00403A9068
MKYLVNACFIFHLLARFVTGSNNCETITEGNDKHVSFICMDQMNLKALEKAWTNTTKIQISDSRIPIIPKNSFVKFGATLKTLDLHGSGIHIIESKAFAGLTKLENLLLWGNQLKTVTEDWLTGMYNLKTLDLSFNNIEVIDYRIFTLFPKLENFYFDYNQIKFIDYTMFAYLQNLKNVKFEKNPLSWGFRAHLTWQLENQHVKYSEDWENWRWMIVVIKECSESGLYGDIPADTILDCVVAKLLDYTFEIFSTNMIHENIDCTTKARQLTLCMRPKNATGNTDNETARRILEDYTAILPTMIRSMSRFSVPSF